jgi:uncharacterized small protein (DUF1192 family)
MIYDATGNVIENTRAQGRTKKDGKSLAYALFAKAGVNV